MKPPTIYQLSATAVGVTLSLLAMGDADAYTFSRIFAGGPYGIGRHYAINNQGTIVFTASLGSDEWPLPHADFPSSKSMRQIIFTANGESLKSITNGFDYFYSVDIGDSNTVAFETFDGSPHFPNFVIKIGDEYPFTTIANDPRPYSPPFGDVAMNDEGIVVFKDFGDIGIDAIYTSDGITRKTIAKANNRIASSFGENLALNNKGLVAFESPLDTGGSGIFTGNGDLINLIADTNTLFNSFNTLSLNDEGTLAFAASLDDGNEGIFISNSGSLTTIANSSELFSSFSNPAINNDGTVVFSAQLQTGEYGIFTGSDPIADKVIAVGDELFGSTVTSLSFSKKGFNDAGQVAFLAGLADGTGGIFRADPGDNGVVLDWLERFPKPSSATLNPIEIDDFSGQETLLEYDSGCRSTYNSIPPHCIYDGVIHIGTRGNSHYQDLVYTNNVTSPDHRFNSWEDKLSVIFPEPQNRLGFGFAMSGCCGFDLEAPRFDRDIFLANAVTVKLFDANSYLLGTLSGDAKQDPWFLGGFFGVESTVPFLRAEITFNKGHRDIAFDNLRYEFVTLPEPVTVPEPSTGLGLLVMSAIGAGSALRHKQN